MSGSRLQNLQAGPQESRQRDKHPMLQCQQVLVNSNPSCVSRLGTRNIATTVPAVHTPSKNLVTPEARQIIVSLIVAHIQFT